MCSTLRRFLLSNYTCTHVDKALNLFKKSNALADYYWMYCCVMACELFSPETLRLLVFVV